MCTVLNSMSIGKMLYSIRKLRSHPLWQPLIFLLVGGWNTLFGVSLYAVAYFFLKDLVNYFVLLFFCNIVAITNAYIFYKLFVFKTKGDWLDEYFRFYGVYGVAMVLGMGLVALEVRAFHFHPVLANFTATIITVMISFVGHKYFSFAAKSNE